MLESYQDLPGNFLQPFALWLLLIFNYVQIYWGYFVHTKYKQSEIFSRSWGPYDGICFKS